MNVYTDNRRPVEVPEAEVTNNTRSALGRAHIPPTKVFRRLAVNKTILKPRVAAATGGQYVYVGFSRRNKISRCSAYTISEKTIRFRHPDYNPDRAQKLISSSTSRHLSTRNISSISMHVFLSNLANRQTDKVTNKHGQKHLPPPLSEVKNYYSSAFLSYIVESSIMHCVCLIIRVCLLFSFILIKVIVD